MVLLGVLAVACLGGNRVHRTGDPARLLPVAALRLHDVGSRAGEAAGTIGGLEQYGTYEEFKLAAERAFLLVKLRQFDWNVAETARALDMPRSNLYKKIERHGLAREQG